MACRVKLPVSAGVLFCVGCCLLANAQELPPRFKKEPESVVASQHGKVVLRCRAEPDTVDIRWKYNDDFITSNKEEGVMIKAGKLILRSFKHTEHYKDHAGIYQCVANNSQGVIVSREAIVSRADIGRFRPLGDKNLTVTQGNTAVIPCEHPESIPMARLIFNVNSTTISSSYGRYHIMPSGSLQILDAHPSDSGVYRCIGVNPVSSKQRKAPNTTTLRVIPPMTPTPPRLVHKPPKELEVKKGDNLTLECVAEGSPVPVISWTKYGGHLPEGRYEKKHGTLVIYNVQERDLGSYVCRAVNGNGKTPTQTVTRVRMILEPPSIVTPPTSQAVDAGGTVTLICETQGRPSVRTMWLHDGEAVVRGPTIKVTDSSLVLSNLQPHQTGMYQCMGRSDLGMTHAEAYVQVRPKKGGSGSPKPTPDGAGVFPINGNPRSRERSKPSITQGPTNTTAHAGENVTLACKAEGATQINWLKDDQPLGGRSSSGRHDNNGAPANPNRGSFARLKGSDITTSRNPAGSNTRYRVLENGALVLTNVTARDSGMYVCLASNQSQIARATGYLTVSVRLVLPEKPTVEIISDSILELHWKVPPNNGLPIKFFKVQYRKFVRNRRQGDWQTVDEEINASKRSFQVLELLPGSTYRFRIVAVYANNDNRHSPNSRRVTLGDSTGTPEPRPGKPILVIKKALSPTEIRLEWQYMGADELHIGGFFIYYKPYDSEGQFQTDRLRGGGHRDYTLRKLKANTNYKIKVSAYTSGGEGPTSNEVVQKTKAVDGSDDSPEYTFSPVPSGDGGSSENSEDNEGNGHDTDGSTGNSTKSSSQLLYMVLGIVLGVMVVLLIIFVSMCWFKQRQQRCRFSINKRKYNDPSKMIHTDSLRKTYLNGGYPLNGLSMMNGSLRNGSLRNGYPPGMLQNGGSLARNGSGMNISINPMQGMEMDSFPSDSHRTLNSSHNGQIPLRPAGSIDDILPPPPPLHTFKSGRSIKSNTSSKNNKETVDNIVAPPELSDDSCCDRMSAQGPPNYSSLSREPTQEIIAACCCEQGCSVSCDLPSPCDYHSSGSCDRSSNRSHGHTPRSQDYVNRSRDHIPRAHELKTRSLPSGEGGQVASRHKRRKRRHPPLGQQDQSMRDQYTNTDPSSNEGTMEINGYRIPSSPEDNDDNQCGPDSPFLPVNHYTEHCPDLPDEESPLYDRISPHDTHIYSKQSPLIRQSPPVIMNGYPIKCSPPTVPSPPPVYSNLSRVHEYSDGEP